MWLCGSEITLSKMDQGPTGNNLNAYAGLQSCARFLHPTVNQISFPAIIILGMSQFPPFSFPYFYYLIYSKFPVNIWKKRVSSLWGYVNHRRAAPAVFRKFFYFEFYNYFTVFLTDFESIKYYFWIVHTAIVIRICTQNIESISIQQFGAYKFDFKMVYFCMAIRY